MAKYHGKCTGGGIFKRWRDSDYFRQTGTNCKGFVQRDLAWLLGGVPITSPAGSSYRRGSIFVDTVRTESPRRYYGKGIDLDFRRVFQPFTRMEGISRLYGCVWAIL